MLEISNISMRSDMFEILMEMFEISNEMFEIRPHFLRFQHKMILQYSSHSRDHLKFIIIWLLRQMAQKSGRSKKWPIQKAADLAQVTIDALRSPVFVARL